MRVWSVRLGTISTDLAGSRKLWYNFALLEACAVPPVGRWKTSVDGISVWMKGSWGRPAVEVAPVSLIPDGIDPSSTIDRISALAVVALQKGTKKGSKTY